MSYNFWTEIGNSVRSDIFECVITSATSYVISIAVYYELQRWSVQSHLRDVPWWENFIEQELRFGLDLEQLALMKKKKIWANYEQLSRPGFLCFHGQKKINKSYRPKYKVA